jgi:hypothetical protein
MSAFWPLREKRSSAGTAGVGARASAAEDMARRWEWSLRLCNVTMLLRMKMAVC